MGSIWDWIKSNPVLAGAAVFLFFVIVIVLGSGTNTEEVAETSSTGVPDYSAAVASSNMLQQMTIQGQVASRASDNTLAGKVAETNAAMAIGKANFEYLTNKDVLASKVAVRGFEADETGARLASNAAITQSNNQRLAVEATSNRDWQIAQLTAGVANNKTNQEAAVAIHLSNNAKNARLREIEALNIKAGHDAALGVHLSNNAQYIRIREIDAGR